MFRTVTVLDVGESETPEHHALPFAVILVKNMPDAICLLSSPGPGYPVDPGFAVLMVCTNA